MFCFHHLIVSALSLEEKAVRKKIATIFLGPILFSEQKSIETKMLWSGTAASFVFFVFPVGSNLSEGGSHFAIPFPLPLPLVPPHRRLLSRSSKKIPLPWS